MAVVVENDIPTPEPAKLSEDDATMAQWLELQASIGASNAATGSVELARFCRDELINIYNTQKVFDYISAEADKANTTWGAHLLRDSDMAWLEKDSIHAAVSKWPMNVYKRQERCYRAAIPIPVEVARWSGRSGGR